MNPVHFLFPSVDIYSSHNDETACGCTGFDQEVIECGEFEEEEPKITSEIVESGVPYKEIEIVINDNRIVLRLQRLPFAPKEEWEPPCDCLPDMIIPHTDREPQPAIAAPPFPPPPLKSDKLSSLQSIDTADNPNLFLLKIRKRSETSDRKRENLDLEFRTPRPWIMDSEPPLKKRKSFHEESQEQKANKVLSEVDMVPTKKKKAKKGKK